MKKTVAVLAIVLAVSTAFAAFTRSVTVSVNNVGPETLSSVVVHVTGNAYELGNIQPGENRSVRVFPTGESHVEIEHAKGRLIVDTYFESGYRGRISVDVTASEVQRIKDDISVGVM
jgi:hypothetical protein